MAAASLEQIEAIRVVRIEREPLAGRVVGLLPPSLLDVDLGQHREAFDETRVDAHRPLCGRLCLGVVIATQQHGCERIVRERFCWIEADRLLRMLGGLLQLVLIREAQGQQPMRFGALGIFRQALAKRVGGVVISLLLKKQRGPLQHDAHFILKNFRMSSYMPPWFA